MVKRCNAQGRIWCRSCHVWAPRTCQSAVASSDVKKSQCVEVSNKPFLLKQNPSKEAIWERPNGQNGTFWATSRLCMRARAKLHECRKSSINYSGQHLKMRSASVFTWGQSRKTVKMMKDSPAKNHECLKCRTVLQSGTILQSTVRHRIDE